MQQFSALYPPPKKRDSRSVYDQRFGPDGTMLVGYRGIKSGVGAQFYTPGGPQRAALPSLGPIPQLRPEMDDVAPNWGMHTPGILTPRPPISDEAYLVPTGSGKYRQPETQAGRLAMYQRAIQPALRAAAVANRRALRDSFAATPGQALVGPSRRDLIGMYGPEYFSPAQIESRKVAFDAHMANQKTRRQQEFGGAPMDVRRLMFTAKRQGAPITEPLARYQAAINRGEEPSLLETAMLFGPKGAMPHPQEMEHQAKMERQAMEHQAKMELQAMEQQAEMERQAMEHEAKIEHTKALGDIGVAGMSGPNGSAPPGLLEKLDVAQPQPQTVAERISFIGQMSSVDGKVLEQAFSLPNYSAAYDEYVRRIDAKYEMNGVLWQAWRAQYGYGGKERIPEKEIKPPGTPSRARPVGRQTFM